MPRISTEQNQWIITHTQTCTHTHRHALAHTLTLEGFDLSDSIIQCTTVCVTVLLVRGWFVSYLSTCRNTNTCDWYFAALLFIIHTSVCACVCVRAWDRPYAHDPELEFACVYPCEHVCVHKQVCINGVNGCICAHFSSLFRCVCVCVRVCVCACVCVRMPLPKHSRASVPAPYVLTLVEGLAVLEVPDRTEGGKVKMRCCKNKKTRGEKNGY